MSLLNLEGGRGRRVEESIFNAVFRSQPGGVRQKKSKRHRKPDPPPTPISPTSQKVKSLYFLITGKKLS